MIINKLRYILVFSVCIFLMGFTFPADEEVVSKFMDEEKQEIQKIKEGEIKNVYFVRLFGGYVPIPSRFVFSSVYNGSARFISRAVIHNDEDMFEGPGDYSLTRDLSGTIVIGDMGEISMKSGDRDSAYKKISSSNFDCYGLSVSVAKYRIPEIEKLFSRVIISDGKRYLEIVDENQEIWRIMMDVYFYLFNKNSDNPKSDLRCEEKH